MSVASDRKPTPVERNTNTIPRAVAHGRASGAQRLGAEQPSGRHAAALPMPGPVVAQVVRLVSDPTVEPQELAAVIAKDPVLSAEIICASNSSFLGARSRIGSVAHACAFMGVRAVRNLVLCLGVRQLVKPELLGGLGVDAFWEASLRRGTAARAIGTQLGLPLPEELFALGLCQDLGVLLACRRRPALGAALVLSAPAARRLELEAAHGIEGGHPELGWRLFEAWAFPEELAVPIRFHHRPEAAPPPHRQRASIAAAAEAMADLLAAVAGEGQAAMRRAEEALGGLSIPADRLPGLVDAVSKDVSEAATMLKFNVTRQPSYQELARTVCQGMFQLNSSYEELTRQLREAVEAKEKLAAELRRVNDELRRANSELAGRAATDALTGLPNRRTFDETLAIELSRPRTLSLLMCDVDRFKALNDKHGHPVGDEVLRAVARAIQSSVRASDVPARYGGEEFGVVLPGTPPEGARIVAERIRSAVAALRMQVGASWISCTISVGGVNVPGCCALSPDDLVARADAALYAAKHGGRNRVMWAPAP